MSLTDLLFSNRSITRIVRHMLYISLLGIAFFLQSLVPGEHIYHTASRSLLCFFPVCILSIYTCLYLLSPLLTKYKHYTLFALGFLAMSLVFLCINCFAADLFFRLAYYYGKPGNASFNLAFLNTTHALIIGGISLGIQFSKNWYLRQKENTLLSRKKVVTELQLEKARIYPRFLHQSLDSLRKDITKGSDTASSLLLKISDLLSYILYDNNEEWVPLEKELVMIQHLVDIEQSGRIRYLDVRVDITGFTSGKYIVPMTLFQLLEHVFAAMDDNRARSPLKLDIQIRIGDAEVMLAIIGQQHSGNGPDWSKVFYRTGQRLDAIYPGGCQLKLKKEKSSCTLLLQAALENREAFSSSIAFSDTTTSLYETS